MDVAAANRSGAWIPWSGVAAVVGSALWVTMPWLQLAAFGTRPYVGTAFDLGAFVGWCLMLVGLAGVNACFEGRLDRSGRRGIGLVGGGMALVTLLLLRRVVVFVGAGFRAVPSTGEDPAGLLLTWGFLVGYGLTLTGAGLLGIGVRGLDDEGSLAAGLLVAAPLFVGVVVALGSASLLPLPVGRAVVRTNLVLVPFAAGWAALGWLVVTTSRAGD